MIIAVKSLEFILSYMNFSTFDYISHPNERAQDHL